MVTEVSFPKEAGSGWGFRLTGGPKFDMPLTVFQVEKGGRAYEAGVRLGDVLVKINGMDAERLSLEQAHDMIRRAGDHINLSIYNLEEQELRENEEIAKGLSLSASEPEDTEDEASREGGLSEASEADTSEVQHSLASEADTSEVQHSQTSAASTTEASEQPQTDASADISDRASVDSDMSRSSRSSVAPAAAAAAQVDDDDEQFVDVNSLPLLPPRPAPEPERAQRKCWHPVMLDTSPPPVIEETTGDEEYPHKKTIRNLRKMIAEKKVTPTPETLIFFLCNKFAVSEERANKISV